MDDATMKAFLSVGRSVLIVGLLLLSHQVNAETPDEWIALGARVHSGFGALVAVGVKIGLDAVKRLNAGPGDLKVTYYDGDKSPCACAADGIAIATYSSVGQRNLIISPKQAPNEAIAVAVIRPPNGGPGLKYTIPISALANLRTFNKDLTPREVYDAVMAASGLFEVEPAPSPSQ
jgi:hypothetical protein